MCSRIPGSDGYRVESIPSAMIDRFFNEIYSFELKNYFRSSKRSSVRSTRPLETKETIPRVSISRRENNFVEIIPGQFRTAEVQDSITSE